ncbi:ABC transporter ATP-binding protein [Paludifilum halophilum]|uniref:ABC transporter ATP-binding protein n=1 Tax=Paludifilum halophilum TaxID=1642702 RepID=UPI00146B9335|nr:ATP-binding cassette domain-containing protein [Paludifilum halophilum]
MRIEWSHLNKVYTGPGDASRERPSYRQTTHTGLLDFSTSVRRGITVVLGPEGAGKSTLLRVTAMASVPDDGRVTYEMQENERYVWSKSVAAMGGIPAVEPLRGRIGYVPEKKRSNREFSLEESLFFMAQSYRIPQPKKRSAELIARWGLAGCRKEPLNELPESAINRYLLVRSLLNEPDIWLLDEPAKGLDEFGFELFCQELARRRSQGLVMIATNDMELAEAADDLLLMENGTCRRIGKRDLLTASVPDGTVASWYKTMQTFSGIHTRSK